MEGVDICRLGDGVRFRVNVNEVIANGLFNFLVAREELLRADIRMGR
jgi:hypothetical protein